MLPALRFLAHIHSAIDYIGLDWLDRDGEIRLHAITWRNYDDTWTVA
jgi:hypothetical protein